MHKRTFKGALGQTVRAQRLRHLKGARLWNLVAQEFSIKEVPEHIRKEMREQRLNVEKK